jgi:hypothetical protein
MKDSQVKRVYAWEKEWPTWNKATISEEECVKIIQDACAAYGVPCPHIKFPRRLLGESYFDPNDQTLLLRKRHRNVAICLHEAAHAIHDYICGDAPHEIHGPEFVAIYLYLLNRAEVASMTALIESAKAYNVAFLPLKTHTPRQIRKTYRKLWVAAEALRDGEIYAS